MAWGRAQASAACGARLCGLSGLPSSELPPALTTSQRQPRGHSGNWMQRKFQRELLPPKQCHYSEMSESRTEGTARPSRPLPGQDAEQRAGLGAARPEPAGLCLLWADVSCFSRAQTRSDRRHRASVLCA